MHNLDNFLKNLIALNADLGSKNNLQFESVVGRGGLFLEESVPASFVSLVSSSKSISVAVSCCRRRGRSRRRGRLIGEGGFLSVTLSSIKDGEEFGAEESVSGGDVGKIEEKSGESENGNESETVAFKDVVNEKKGRLHKGGGTLNTAKHLWAGAVAAMVSSVYKGIVHYGKRTLDA
ncbi:unnamed protein product [Fraxinus pennsylvanica]|uniref:Uncharacterized protein n=1 Tax=Fraxinus pennsylvanica TaxID=56036 RepID=A0AAD2EAL5_9LAMI|nr:unnamed protein product [Fraxinus pennsylvanica]